MKNKLSTGLKVLLVLVVAASTVNLESANAKPLKSCGVVSTAGGRTYQNVVCKNGFPNSQATRLLKQATPLMMKLKKTASMHVIYQAICKDWQHSTGPDLMVTYDYLVALNDWTASRYQNVYSTYPDCDQY